MAGFRSSPRNIGPDMVSSCVEAAGEMMAAAEALSGQMRSEQYDHHTGMMRSRKMVARPQWAPKWSTRVNQAWDGSGDVLEDDVIWNVI